MPSTIASSSQAAVSARPGGDGSGRSGTGEDLLERTLPPVHLLPHARGERIVPGSERPGLHPDEGDVVAVGIEERLDELQQALAQVIGVVERGDHLFALGRHDQPEDVGDEGVHPRPVVRHECGGDPDASRDRADGEALESALAGKADRTVEDRLIALLRRHPPSGRTC